MTAVHARASWTNTRGHHSSTRNCDVSHARAVHAARVRDIPRVHRSHGLHVQSPVPATSVLEAQFLHSAVMHSDGSLSHKECSTSDACPGRHGVGTMLSLFCDMSRNSM